MITLCARVYTDSLSAHHIRAYSPGPEAAGWPRERTLVASFHLDGREAPIVATTTETPIVRTRLTMPCDIEARRPSYRQAAWHADCPQPTTCTCPAHQRDEHRRADR